MGIISRLTAKLFIFCYTLLCVAGKATRRSILRVSSLIILMMIAVLSTAENGSMRYSTKSTRDLSEKACLKHGSECQQINALSKISSSTECRPLMDSGSYVHCCGKSCADDNEIYWTAHKNMRNAEGGKMLHYGARNVDYCLARSSGD